MVKLIHQLMKLTSPEFLAFMRYGAIAGFLVSTTLLISLSRKAYNNLFQQKAKSLWWIFIFACIILLLLFLYIFNLIFEDASMLEEGKLVLKFFGMRY